MAKKQKGVWDISIEINGKEVKNNLQEVGKSVGELYRDLKKLQPGTDEFIKKSAELKKAREHYTDIKNEINDTNVSLEEARGHFSNIFTGILSGDIKQVQSGLQGIQGGIKGMTKAGLAFIATPIGVAIALLSGIGLAAKKWVDFNLHVFETNKLVKELTNQSGDAVDAIRIRAEVLNDTFEIDINKSITTAKSLVASFGISYDEAFNLIEQSAVRGKTKNDEYFASLEEYPIQFKNAGFSATEFIDIVNTGIDLSIYKDKLPDAIKEFTLAITEQTPAAKEAMSNAFGKQFTDTLFADIENGVKSPKEALQSIALEAQNIGLNSQQAQLLTADLFKGAGEDAGGALKIFESVNIALNGQQKPLTENQELTAKQLELNKELSGVYTQLFASSNSGFANLIAKGKVFATETLLKVLKGGVDVYNWFIDLNNQSGIFSALLSGIGKMATGGFEVLGILISNAWKSVKGLGNIVAGVFTLDVDQIKKGFSQQANALTGAVSDLKNKAVKDVNDIYDAFSGKNQAKKINLKDLLADDTSETNNTPIVTNNDPDNPDGELTAEDKRIIASKKKLAEFLKTFEEEQEIQKELLKFEKAKREEEEELLRLEMKYQKMAEDAGFETILAAELEEAYNSEVQAVTDKWAEVKLKNKEKEDAKHIKADKKLKAALLKAEEDLENAKRVALSKGVDFLGAIFGEKSEIYKAMLVLEKALAINEVVVNTSKANAQIASNLAIANAKAVAASPLTGGLPFTAINSAIAAKSTATNNIVAGIQIAGIAGAAIQGFYDGGYTGKNAIGYDKDGAITGVVHEEEWVAPKIMTSNPKYAANFQYLEAERQRLQKGYFNGGYTSNVENAAIGNTPSPEAGSNSSNLSEMIVLNNQLLNILITNGIKANLVLPYDKIKELQEYQDEIEDSANYGTIAS